LHPTDRSGAPGTVAPAGYPTPAVVVDICPTTVMRRHPAPRFIGDPIPTQGVVPDPAPVSKRNPIIADAGAPDSSIAGIAVPGAIVVKICCCPALVAVVKLVLGAFGQVGTAFFVPAVPVILHVICAKIVTIRILA